MEIAVVENDYVLPTVMYEHDWIHILYMGISTIFFLIQVCQRISVDLFYSSNDLKTGIYIASLNRYPTELTPSPSSISYIWYIVFIWQAILIIYSIIGVFRRTSSGSYFYQHPCAMNKWCFFYMAFGLILYTPQLAAAAKNKYGIGISIFRHVGTLCEVLIILVVVHVSLWENLNNYLRQRFFVDVWLTRLLYHNGLALWASVLFYESCLSIVIGFIYSNYISPITASFIGCSVLLFGLLILSILENIIFYNSLAFTLSPWFAFIWLLGGIVFRQHDELSSSIDVICFPLNLSCQLFSNLSSYPFQIINNSNVTVYLLQLLVQYTPCCSNLTWLITQMKSKMNSLNISSITGLALDSNNNRLATVASSKLQLVSTTSFSFVNSSINLPPGSQAISYSQDSFYVGIFPAATPYTLYVYSALNLTKTGNMNFTQGGPQRIIWLFNNTLVCVLTQTNPTSVSKANFYNWPSNTLNQSITLPIPNAYGLGKASNNDSFVYITDGSWGGNIWQLKTTSPYNFTLFATSATSSESPTSVTFDGCNRMWAAFVNFGVRIYDINSRSLLYAWNLTSTYSTLYDIVITNQYQLYLADKTSGTLARYGSELQCTN
ncbi:unnamed protein product [Adineta steineri]|uniref:Transmembrane protein n=1 Tax=Adineta steineri TaxID=433720 RepID=A0A815GIP9_9BILA|nr:unnamed protein product [Adineta steineri]CAF1592662.1 unnamed protein product [Adineta steineri]